MNQYRLTRSRQYVILMTLAAVVPAVAVDGTAMRLERAAAVLHSVTEPAHSIRPEHLASADCIVVIPKFKIGAAVVGIGYGRGLARMHGTCHACCCFASSSL